MRAEPSLSLDTHIWLWLACGIPEKIGPGTLKTIEQAGNRRTLFVSIISVWEIALHESTRRIALPMPTQKWMARARNAILVTADQRILGYSKLGHVKTLAP